MDNRLPPHTPTIFQWPNLGVTDSIGFFLFIFIMFLCVLFNLVSILFQKKQVCFVETVVSPLGHNGMSKERVLWTE